MAFVEHFRAVTHFALGPASTPKEKASCTLNFSKSIDAGTAQMQTIADDMFSDWSAWVQDPSARVSSDVALTEVALYSVGTNGRIDQDPVRTSETAVRGVTGGDKRHPWQCTICVTLVAGARGPGHLGRFFLPPQVFGVTSDGLIQDSDHATIFSTTHGLLTNLSNAPGLDSGPINESFGLRVASGVGAGSLRPVIEIRLGRVCDTQRRRRRQLEESYVSQAFTP